MRVQRYENERNQEIKGLFMRDLFKFILCIPMPSQMIKKVTSVDYTLLSRSIMPVLDVRSESEYLQGHIPGAINLPLFNNEERAIVGTLFKNSGREASVIKGLEMVGPKLADYVKQLHKITPGRKILLYCWRGGMRSGSMAWLFEQAGYEVFVLVGGYKAYRHFILDYFGKNLHLTLVGGKTGSGKTDILHALEAKGEQVLDIEKLANHKGSVFGAREDGFQPNNEQFYNDIFEVLYKQDSSKMIWIEDESRNIGRVSIPDPLFERMTRSPLIRLECPKEIRISRLVKEYAGLPKAYLEECLEKIREKMGGDRMKTAKEALAVNNFHRVADLALEYYDKSYEHSMAGKSKEIIHTISITSDHPNETADLLLSFIKKQKIA